MMDKKSIKRNVLSCLREQISWLAEWNNEYPTQSKCMISPLYGIVFDEDDSCYLYPNFRPIPDGHMRVQGYMYWHPSKANINEYTSDYQLRKLADDITEVYLGRREEDELTAQGRLIINESDFLYCE